MLTPCSWFPPPGHDSVSEKAAHAEPEVEVDEEGHEVIRLKGLWHVGTHPLLLFRMVSSGPILGALPPSQHVPRLGYLNSIELPT